ncbi:hypothetical protein ABES58_24280 [Paenibacillus lautus]|uniref:hypothetical protein n=1 Tax=Paenibacillus lautus TaxID=1401 RepID=UPI003D27BFC8
MDYGSKENGEIVEYGQGSPRCLHALRENMVVIPYAQSEGEPNQRENMTSFLKSIDILWADLYPSSTYALNLRDELGLTCPAMSGDKNIVTLEAADYVAF